jgi:hypothetical protein
MSRAVTLAAIGAVAAIIVAKTALTPASWPESTLKAWLRRRTPYGTPEAQVRRFLQDRAWRSIWMPGQDSLNRALGHPFSGGSHTLEAVVGDYRSPRSLFIFVTSTEVFYGFGDDNKLVDIQVRKTTDAP